MKASKESKTLKFEEAVEQLESIVQEMENDQLPLDQLIQRYEDGTKLVKFCQEKLSDAEQKVEILTNPSKAASKEKSSSTDDLELQ